MNEDKILFEFKNMFNKIISSPIHMDINESTLSIVSGKYIQIGTNALLVCKDGRNIDKIDASIVSRDKSNSSINISWNNLSGYNRIYLSIGELFRGISASEYSVFCEIECKAQNVGPEECEFEWLAILQKNSEGSYRFLNKIASEILIPNDAKTFRWQFQFHNSSDIDYEDIPLAIQIAKANMSFKIYDFSIKIISISSKLGAIGYYSDGFIDGWLSQAVVGGELVITRTGLQDVVKSYPLQGGKFFLNISDHVTHGNSSEGVTATIKKDGFILSYLDITKDIYLNVKNKDKNKIKNNSDAENVPAIQELQRLYSEKRQDEIWRLYSLSPLSDDNYIPNNSYEAWLIYFYARTFLDVNASQTAYENFRRLFKSQKWNDFFSFDDIRKIKKNYARTCLRSGRQQESEAVLTELMHDDPTDWDCYFQLANTLSSKDYLSKRLYYKMAESLANKFPSKMGMVVIEDLIEQELYDDAFLKCVTAMKKDKNARELNFTLSNIYLAKNDRKLWFKYLAKLFESYDLSVPIADLNIGNNEDIFSSFLSNKSNDYEEYQDKSVTVIMTAFNAEKTIETSIRSVLNQRHKNINLVVVDDVSSDRTSEIVLRISNYDSRVKLINNSSNMGTYCAKNIAIAAYKSDYYAFHDSDDWMHPDRISSHVKLMEENPSLVCSTSLWFRMDQRGYAMVRKGGGYLHDNPASTFFSRSVIDQLGFFDSVRTGADSELLWRIRRHFGRSSIIEISKPLAIGLHHSESLTQAGAAAFDEHRFSQTRLLYWESWVNWHKNASIHGTEQLYMPFPNINRTFKSPPEITPDTDTLYSIIKNGN